MHVSFQSISSQRLRAQPGAGAQRCSQHLHHQELTSQFIFDHANEIPRNRHAPCLAFSLPTRSMPMRTCLKKGMGARYHSEFRHGYMPVIDHASALAFRVSLLAKCPGSASHARHEKRLKTPPQSQNPPNHTTEK